MPAITVPSRTFDPQAVRAQIPALRQTVRDGQPLVYLDNAATTLKPQAMIDRLERYYGRENANIHRGVHALSQAATDAYEDARERVARFLNAPSEREVIFVRGVTEAINLVATCFGAGRLETGDEVLVTGLEHHANIVPWQMACERTGAKLVHVPSDARGVVDLGAFRERLSERTKMASFLYVSNALGTILPAHEMVAACRERGVPTLVDAAQAAPHLPLDVQALGCDFLCFSGHKVYGPTGIGALWGKMEHLEAMPPWQGGGDMIDQVRFEGTTFAPPPARFEAGTPHIAGAVGLAAALDWLDDLGLDAVREHEADVLAYATERVQEVEGLRLIGTAPEKASVLSFLVDGAHAYDIGTLLDQQGIAVRTGHHCAQPLMDALGLTGTARASFAVYNIRDDADALADGLARARRFLV